MTVFGTKWQFVGSFAVNNLFLHFACLLINSVAVC